MRFVLKIIHNEHFALLWALVVEIGAHGYFSLQGFLFGGFLGEIALAVVFGSHYGTLIGAWMLAAFIFGSAFCSFVLGEYLREHVQSFTWSGKGDQSFIKAFEDTRRMVMGLELCSLAYRVLYVGLHDHDWISAIITGAFGILILWYAVKMAKVIHASVNRPIEHDLERSQHRAGQTLAEKAMRYTKNMDPEQLARYADGDVSALQEVAENGFFEEEQRRAAKASKRQAKLTKQLGTQNRETEGQERIARFGENRKKLFNPENWKRNRTYGPAPVLKIEPANFQEVQTSNNHQAQRLDRN